MTAPLRSLVIGYRTRLAACQRRLAGACALAVTAMSVALPLVASAQRIDGAIGVSLVILPPTAARTVAVTAFHVDRDGLATIRATAPRAPGPSPVVMTRVLSSADGFLPTRYVPALPCAPDGATRELRYRIDVRGSADGGAPRDVHLRMEYVVVAGT